MLAELSYQTIAVVWLGAFVGGIATGGAGFAFAVVAASIWLHVLDPLITAALVVSTGDGGLGAAAPLSSASAIKVVRRNRLCAILATREIVCATMATSCLISCTDVRRCDSR